MVCVAHSIHHLFFNTVDKYTFFMYLWISYVFHITKLYLKYMHLIFYSWITNSTCKFIFFLRFHLFILNRREGRERNINVWLPFTCPLLETWQATQVCALTGNRTSNHLVCRPAINPLHWATPARASLVNF